MTFVSVDSQSRSLSLPLVGRGDRRSRWVGVPLALLLMLFAAPTFAQPVESFDSFLRNFEGQAVAAGVDREVYRRAVEGLTPDPNVPELVTAQPEFTAPMWEYIDTRVNDKRIARGIAAMGAEKALFEAAGKAYGVDPYVLGAIWGIETDYGSVLGNKKLIRPIIRSLATLVHQRRTRFEGDTADFIAALKMVQAGPLDRDTLVGSWAGAIGHLQVNPSNILEHGRDGDGDGKIDLHNSLPDALATSATFLRDLGYLPGSDWGFEVTLPDNFDYTLATRDKMRTVRFFAERGVRRIKGKQFTDPDLPVFLYVPTGASGPKFLMTQNYLALKGYNFSDSYAMAVAHLTDRLKGAGDFEQPWPTKTKFPNLAQRKAIQQSLTELGLYSGIIDGRLGPISQQAYAQFQAGKGEVADGFITLKSYEELAAATQ
jgi:membrane-bound lytic murein transglycosylase B